MANPDELRLTAEVHDALKAGRPVVALESTILAHGFPFPDNQRLAGQLESAVRDHGAVPATICVIDGELRVGLDKGELDRLTHPEEEVAKAAALDLGVAVASGGVHATTVSATMRIATMAGIRVFATGGIGGVHRGDTGDVSSDLLALSRDPVCVVSSGVKAILDLPRTMEALESMAVPVFGVGTGELPAFYSRTSGVPLVHRFDRLEPLANACAAHHRFGGGGILVANPISEADEIPAPDIAPYIDDALAQADEQGIRGKATTPFLLAALAEATQGRAVAANRSLALGNAEVAARLASLLALRP